MTVIPSVKSARGAIGAAKRWNHLQLPERHRDLEVAKLAAHIAAVAVASPPPTPEQVIQLTAGLIGGVSA